MKVGVVGSGMVGATAAYALVMRGVGREIVLVDKNAARAAAEADDLRHAVPFAHPLEVRAGDYPDLAGCQVVVLCAGVGQKPGETRLNLLRRNAGVCAEVVPAVGDPATVKRDIDEKVRRAAYTIIAGKGATYYGVGCALARIVDVVIHDQRSILTVCAPTADVAGVKDVTVALPRLVGGAGVLA